jgi:4-hydroxy-3-methylbut-2-enyl diphosphate reductase
MNYDLQRLEIAQGVDIWKPTADMLHDPNVLPQSSPCEAVFLGLPLGECGGVLMANIAISRLATQGSVYGNHEATHGADATAQQEAMGVRFGDSPDIIPANSLYVISAHGAAPSVGAAANERGLQLFDVTCPLVHRTHRAILDAPAKGPSHVAYISFGKPEHPELVGAAGLAEEAGIPFSVLGGESDIDGLLAEVKDGETITIVGQTTNNSDEATILARQIQGRARERGITVAREKSHDVCHTVRDRQLSAREIVAVYNVGALVVVGSVNSKNTKSLADVAAKEAISRELPLTIYLANSWGQIPSIEGRVGVVSGASTLAQNVHGVIDRLAPTNGVIKVGEDTDRGIVFSPVDTKTRGLFEDEDKARRRS